MYSEGTGVADARAEDRESHAVEAAITACASEGLKARGSFTSALPSRPKSNTNNYRLFILAVREKNIGISVFKPTLSRVVEHFLE